MYTVVGHPRNRSFRVLWMLEELGEDYDILIASPHSDVIKSGNPGGKAPVLLDGEAAISDSVAIVTYLADKHGACTHPAGTLERGRQDAITQFCVDEIEGALWTTAKNTFVHPEDKRCPDIAETCRFEFAKAMTTLDAHLAQAGAFIAGDQFTVPDLLLGHCARWAGNAKFDIPAGPVADYLARVRARPAYERASQRGQTAIEAHEAAA